MYYVWNMQLLLLRMTKWYDKYCSIVHSCISFSHDFENFTTSFHFLWSAFFITYPLVVGQIWPTLATASWFKIRQIAGANLRWKSISETILPWPSPSNHSLRLGVGEGGVRSGCCYGLTGGGLTTPDTAAQEGRHWRGRGRTTDTPRIGTHHPSSYYSLI